MSIKINRLGTWQEVSREEFLELVRDGAIDPNTEVIVNDKKAIAARLKGIVFPSQVAVPTPPPAASQAARAVPVPHSAPKQSYCTNCSKAVSEQAAACMSCGAKPTGYKKFCRQCGVALNPEQVVCIQCGASVVMPIMADAKRVVQSVMSSSAPFVEKTKQLPKPAIIVGIAIVAVAGVACLAMLLFSIGGGGSLGNVIPATLTVAERAETDKYIARYGRGAIAGYLGALERHQVNNTDNNLVLKYLKYFVSQGADVNAKDDLGKTPIFYAVEFGNVDVVNFLVSKGVDVNTNNGGLLLRNAVRKGNVDVVKSLVSKGADVNANNGSPLHWAVYACTNAVDPRSTSFDPEKAKRFVEVIRFLVSKGADVNAMVELYDGEVKKTPLDRAKRLGNMEIIKILSGVNNSTEQPVSPRQVTGGFGSGSFGGGLGGAGGEMSGGRGVAGMRGCFEIEALQIPGFCLCVSVVECLGVVARCEAAK